MDLAPDLVENLMDPDGAVRLFTMAALRELTGEDFGYKPHGTPEERQSAVARWKAWLETRSAPPAPGGSEAAPGGAGSGVPAGGTGPESLPEGRAPAEEGGDG